MLPNNLLLKFYTCNQSTITNNTYAFLHFHNLSHYNLM